MINKILDKLLYKDHTPVKRRLGAPSPDVDLDEKYCGIHCRSMDLTQHCDECHVSMKGALG